jgi:hypothetical protein
MIQSRKRSDPPPRPVTLSAAEDLGPFELAELAVLSALAR